MGVLEGYGRETVEEARKDARERAWAGYQDLLKAGYPFDAVELKRLDMSSPSMCMLGQGYGGFSDGLAELAVDLGRPSINDPFVSEEYTGSHGFDIDGILNYPYALYMDMLDEAWSELTVQHRMLGEATGW